MTNGQIVAVKILNLEAQIAPLEDIVHEAQTMKVSRQLLRRLTNHCHKQC